MGGEENRFGLTVEGGYMNKGERQEGRDKARDKVTKYRRTTETAESLRTSAYYFLTTTRLFLINVITCRVQTSKQSKRIAEEIQRTYEQVEKSHQYKDLHIDH